MIYGKMLTLAEKYSKRLKNEKDLANEYGIPEALVGKVLRGMEYYYGIDISQASPSGESMCNVFVDCTKMKALLKYDIPITPFEMVNERFKY